MIRRKLKNAVNKYTDAEVKVREATSNDPWGPSSTLMSSIADLTYQHNTYPEVMAMLWRRLNDKSKIWRHIYKGLVLLEYIVKTGSPRVAEECQEYMHTLQMLHDFQCVEENKDHGLSVREKSKSLVALLRDASLLEVERSRALTAKERLSGGPPNTHNMGKKGKVKKSAMPTNEEPVPDEAIDDIKPRNEGEEDLQLQVALAMSKEEHEKEERIRKDTEAKDDAKVRLAVQQSHEDEEMALKVNTTAKHEDPFSSPSNDIWGTSSVVPQNDPWATAIPPTTATHDPWATPITSTPPVVNNSPFSGVSPSHTAPFPLPASSTHQQLPSDASSAWTVSNTAPIVISNATSPFALPVNSTVDPWGTVPENNGKAGHAGKPGNVFASDDFEFIASRAPQSTEPWGWDSTGGGVTHPASGHVTSDLKGVDRRPSADSASFLDHKRSPTNFLGDNAALVNLDSLIIKSKSPTNPFTGLPTTATADMSHHQPQQSFDRPRSTNPFAVNQPAPVPLNQLAIEARGPIFSVHSTIPNTVETAVSPSSGYPSANNPWAVPAPTSINPFL